MADGRWLMGLCPLELQPYVDKVIRRPRAGALERQLVEAAVNRLHFRVERRLLIARDEERGVHDHLIADRLVDARRERHLAELMEDVGDVTLRARLQGGIDQPAVL